MSLLSEYINACCGYDEQGHPAATTQFTFGMMPFSVSDEDRVEDFTQISTVCQTEAIVDIQIIDSIIKVEFDFSLDTETFVDLVHELDFYKDQLAHVTNTLNGYTQEFERAIDNEDEDAIEEMNIKFRSMSVPFMIPTIVPSEFGGEVHISFYEDPKFVFWSSDKINQLPSKLVLIFDANSLFAEDETGVYDVNEEDEIRLQQEEMYLAAEARKAEEEAYQSQYGYSNDPYAESDDSNKDSRLKGVRLS